MARAAIGIDFGHSHVKLVELRRSGRQVQLKRASLLPLPPATLRAGEVADEKVLADSLSDLIPGLRMERAAVVAGCSGPAVAVRAMTLQTAPNEDLDLAVYQELAALLRLEPARMEEYYFDYHVLPSNGPSEQEVVAVGVERKVVEGYLRPLRTAHLDAHVLDVAAFALPRIEALPGQVCYIDIGAEYTEVMVTSDQEYVVFRRIPGGMNHLISAAAVGYSISQSEARKLCEQTHIDELVTEAPGDRTHLQRVLQEIAGGVVQTLEFLRVRQRASSITELLAAALVCGGGALQPGMVQMLREELGLHVEVMRPLSSLSGAEGLSPNTVATEPLFASAVGLAMRGVEDL